MKALTYNLSIGAGAAAMVAGVALLHGVAWALVAAGALVLALTFATISLTRPR